MSDEILTAIMLLGLGALITLISYLFSQKNADRKEEIKELKAEIKDLQLKHELDVEKLVIHEKYVAKEHYDTTEIDALFKYFREYLDERFKSVIDTIHQITGHEP